MYKRQAVKAANKEKAHAQVALSYTLGDAYTLEYWVNIAKRIEEMGADSICIKDMAGLLLPYKATELVGALKDAVSIPIDLHTHLSLIHIYSFTRWLNAMSSHIPCLKKNLTER